MRPAQKQASRSKQSLCPSCAHGIIAAEETVSGIRARQWFQWSPVLSQSSFLCDPLCVLCGSFKLYISHRLGVVNRQLWLPEEDHPDTAPLRHSILQN